MEIKSSSVEVDVLTVRSRTIFCLVVGFILLLHAMSVPPGPNNGIPVSFLIGAPMFLWFGIAVPVFRVFIKSLQSGGVGSNDYFMDRLCSNIDGPIGPFLMWFVGVDRNGTLRP